jgi:hypothetical protein
MNPCPNCGATTPRRKVDAKGRCLSEYGCLRRSCKRRRDEDRKRFSKENPWKQCYATTGSTSISFCELGVDHEGLHQRDTKQWGGNERHPLAQLIRAATNT